MTTLEDALTRVRAEFLEMPGMHLKPEQVQRLCGVERGLCQAVLDSLVDAKFLYVSAGGQYARIAGGEMSSHRAARAVNVAPTVYRRGARQEVAGSQR